MIVWNAGELEHVACDYCGATELRPVTTRPDSLRPVECARCGLCFLSPRPRESVIGRLYEKDYFENAGQGPSGYAAYSHESSRAALDEMAAMRLNLLRGEIALRGARVLETGAATGELGARMVRAGAQVVATDISQFAIDEARRRHRHARLELRHGGWAAVPERAGFDAVVAFEVIEHVPRPHEFFREAAARLAPGGVLVLSTPNYACARRLGPERWLGFRSSFEHLYFFDILSLSRFGSKAGLRLRSWYAGYGDGLAPDAAPAPAAKPSAPERLLRGAARFVRRQLRAHTALPLHLYRREDPAQHQLVAVFEAGRAA